MSNVHNILGNILIKHNDKWRGDYYLKDDLTFTTDRSLAARFYLLKSGDTTILNGDRISINSGNKTLSISNSNTLQLVDREQHYHNFNTFLITNGTDHTDPITFETILYFISNRDDRTALKYEWSMDLIGMNDIALPGSLPGSFPGSLPGSLSYKPRSNPSLSNSSYNDVCPTYINSFEFLLEKADRAIITLDGSHATLTKPNKNDFDNYKGAFLIFLLFVILILCILVNK